MNDDVQTNYAWGQTVGDGCRDTAVDKLLHQPATCGSLLTRKLSNPQPPLSGWLGGGRRKSSCRVRPRCRFEVRVVRSQQLPRIALRAFLGEDESLLFLSPFSAAQTLAPTGPEAGSRGTVQPD